MKKRLLVVQHNTVLEPYLLGQILEDERVDHDVVDLETARRMPIVENYDAVAGLGGWNDIPDEELLTSRDLVRGALRDGMPFLGICLMGQRAADEKGASIIRKPIESRGFRAGDNTLRTLRKTQAGDRSPLFEDVVTHVTFNLNGWIVDPDSLGGLDIQVLAYDQDCPVQAAQLGPEQFTVQWHPEINNPAWKKILADNPDLLEEYQDAIRRDFVILNSIYMKSSEQLLRNWLKIAGLLTDSAE